MGVRILTFLPVSLHKCPLNPSVCVGGIIPQTPGCTDISYELKCSDLAKRDRDNV